MERVAFLIEETGERIGCMLNPQGLVIRRSAGVRPAQSTSGQLTGKGMTDNPLFYTGGGHTELELELLFDVTLAGTTINATDVRDLTGPLWRLAENAQRADGFGYPPLARFVWGKAWNILGVVTSVAERFDFFSASGEPQRSWLKLRFVRVNDTNPPAQSSGNELVAKAIEDLPDIAPPEVANSTDIEDIHTVVGDGTQGESLVEIANQYGLGPAGWRLLAWFNNIEDPLHLSAGLVIRIPKLSTLNAMK